MPIEENDAREANGKLKRDDYDSPVILEPGGQAVDVDAGFERKCSRMRQVRGDPMVNEFGNGVVVGHDDAVEFHFLAQPPAQVRAIRGHGHSIEIGERRHDRRDGQGGERLALRRRQQ